MDDLADYNRRNVFSVLVGTPQIRRILAFSFEISQYIQEQKILLSVLTTQPKNEVHLYDIDCNLRNVLTPQI